VCKNTRTRLRARLLSNNNCLTCKIYKEYCGLSQRLVVWRAPFHLNHEEDYPNETSHPTQMVILLLVLPIALCGTAFGQEITGNLNGTVKDSPAQL
jgi:hypothetical protein